MDKKYEGLYPDKCPITGRELFMLIDHPEKGMVPTYGGPYESYTIPECDEANSDDKHVRFEYEKYDHDYDCWMTPDDGKHQLDVVLISENTLIDLEDKAAQRDAALEAVEKLREALKDRMSIYYAKDVPHQSDHPHCRCRSCVNARTHEALAATEPATVELPKCGHCGAIACGTDCDGSSHYTADCHP